MPISASRSFNFCLTVPWDPESYQKKNRWTVQVKKWAYGPKSTNIAEKSKFDQCKQIKNAHFCI